jgi:hypothetical protein
MTARKKQAQPIIFKTVLFLGRLRRTPIALRDIAPARLETHPILPVDAEYQWFWIGPSRSTMVAGCRVLHSSVTGSAQPQRLHASPPRQDQNPRASGSGFPGFVPNPRDKGSIRSVERSDIMRTLENQLPGINLANGGSMQNTQVVTLKSEQQNASPVDSTSPMHSFELRTRSTLPVVFESRPKQFDGPHTVAAEVVRRVMEWFLK